MYAGKGGYAVGNKNLSKNYTLYIAVGQKGGVSSNANYAVQCAFNGGGGAYGRYNKSDGELFTEIVGGGGGATSIQNTLIGDGQLKNYTNNKNNVIIVAGAGGGGTAHRYPDPNDGGRWCGYGGAGGGEVGLIGDLLVTGEKQRSQLPTAGSQTAPGVGYDATIERGTAGFGYGMDCYAFAQYLIDGSASGGSSGGGGGGWYGGGTSVYGASAGGSSYINGVNNGRTIAGNIDMPKPGGGTETGHSGNGYCKITWHPTL